VIGPSGDCSTSSLQQKRNKKGEAEPRAIQSFHGKQKNSVGLKMFQRRTNIVGREKNKKEIPPPPLGGGKNQKVARLCKECRKDMGNRKKRAKVGV